MTQPVSKRYRLELAQELASFAPIDLESLLSIEHCGCGQEFSHAQLQHSDNPKTYVTFAIHEGDRVNCSRCGAWYVAVEDGLRRVW